MRWVSTFSKLCQFIMKAFLLAILAVASVSALPYSHDPEYAMIPDGRGNMKLVNIQESADAAPFFDATADTVFFLFTNLNGQITTEILDLQDHNSILNSQFNPNNGVRFIIHGWQSDVDSTVLIRNAYLSSGNFNVIAVDWSAGAETINYVAARNRVGGVGAVTAQMIRQINRAYSNIHPRDITVVGHSLGAHAAGFAGRNLFDYMRLHAVVALDAALPLFSFDLPNERINDQDAEYVESIHTNAGLLGFDQPLGTANFYPNGGSSQPGCNLDLAGSCSHSRAVEFFAESINSDRGFWARQCASYDEIVAGVCTVSGVDRKMGGEPVQTLARGIYWLTTNRSSPFATGIL